MNKHKTNLLALVGQLEQLNLTKLSSGGLLWDMALASLRKTGDMDRTHPDSGSGVQDTTWTPKGLKYDQDKPRMDLLDSDALLGLAKVLTFGAQKYDAHNWRGGIKYSRLIAAIHRHLAAINSGEDIDPESGLPHIDHLGCCWMFLSYFSKHDKFRESLDDRYK